MSLTCPPLPRGQSDNTIKASSGGLAATNKMSTAEIARAIRLRRRAGHQKRRLKRNSLKSR